MFWPIYRTIAIHNSESFYFNFIICFERTRSLVIHLAENTGVHRCGQKKRRVGVAGLTGCCCLNLIDTRIRTRFCFFGLVGWFFALYSVAHRLLADARRVAAADPVASVAGCARAHRGRACVRARVRVGCCVWRRIPETSTHLHAPPMICERDEI